MDPTHKSQLKSLFPSLAEGVLEAVYSSKAKNLDDTINALLEMNNTVLTEGEKRAVKKSELEAVTDKVMLMPRDETAKRLAGNYGLSIGTVAYEDSGRTKGSVWGPCISDMTLNVDDRALPLIRYPNFEDLTWDVPIEKIPLVVGNEVGTGELYTVDLKEYLDHLKMYLHDPSSWLGDETSLLADRDTHVIMSAQACFLPVPKSGEAKFNASIFNYQSRAGDPAVLAIVATAQGTSAQIVDGSRHSWAGQKLYFNKNGDRASFIGERLSDDRKKRGVSTTGDMTAKEKAQNMIMIIQVPLRQKSPPPMVALGYSATCIDDGAMPGCLEEDSSAERQVAKRPEADVEDAIIRVGESEGKFTECGGIALKRDERYPVRVTLQYYKSTANGIVDDAAISKIASQIEEARKYADNVGSLVVGGDTGRPTEHTGPSSTYPALFVPRWWNTFWLTYKSTLPPALKEDQAKQRLFSTSYFEGMTFEEAKAECLSRLKDPETTPPLILPTSV